MIPQHILVPIDFSTYADRALEYAIALARQLQSRLLLLHVRDDVNLNPLAYSGQATATARQALEACLKRVQGTGVDGALALVHGVPWQEIVDMANSQQVDLIIMGTYGRTGLQHLLLGSVAAKVIRLARCPVLVTRSPEDAPDPDEF